MHREHAVEDLGRNKIVVRTDQLDAHDRRLDPADHEKHQGVEDVQDAQPLVIDGGTPTRGALDQRRRDAGSALGSAMASVDIGDLLSLNRFSEASPGKRSLHPVPDRSTPSLALCEPGLIASGFLNPEPQIFRRVWRRAGGDRLAAHQVRQVRAESAVRHRARDRCGS